MSVYTLTYPALFFKKNYRERSVKKRSRSTIFPLLIDSCSLLSDDFHIFIFVSLCWSILIFADRSYYRFFLYFTPRKKPKTCRSSHQSTSETFKKIFRKWQNLHKFGQSQKNKKQLIKSNEKIKKLIKNYEIWQVYLRLFNTLKAGYVKWAYSAGPFTILPPLEGAETYLPSAQRKI